LTMVTGISLYSGGCGTSPPIESSSLSDSPSALAVPGAGYGK
jgi:hypothetical protein